MADENDNVPTALTTNTFTKAGYTFAGWSTTPGGTTVDYANSASYPFATDADLYAVWTAIPSHTVTFNNSAGTGTMTAETANVSTALTANTFSKAGFILAGWSTTPGGTTVAYADSANYPFTADATLYAVWTSIADATVNFHANGGIGTMAAESANVPTALTSNTFSRPGFTFDGWATSANGAVVYADGASYPFITGVNLFAHWTAIPNTTVTFDSNLGTGTMSDQAANVPTALDPNTFTRPGFTFGGWNTAQNGTGTAYPNDASYPFDSNTTLYAQWTTIPNKTVTFDPNGGMGAMADEVDNVPTPLTANTFTRAGWNFLGWNTATNGGGTTYNDVASYAFTVNATLYAQWTQLAVLTFDANGGSGSLDPLSANVPTNLPTTTVNRPGYQFLGWNTAADGSGTEYAPGALYPFASNGVLYAQWSKVILAFTGVDTTSGMTLAMLLLSLGLVLV